MTSFNLGVISYVVLVFCLFMLLLLASGCISMLGSPQSYSDLSPAQIKALQAMDLDVYACATISGPPPSGRVIYVTVPRLDKKPDIRFGPDCQIK